MAVLSPLVAADNARAAAKNQPEGGVGAVSGSGDEGLFQKLAGIASGILKRSAATTVEALKPGNIFVPGGSKAANAAAQVAGAATEVAKSAGEGIKAGFSRATLIITLVAAFLLWRFLK
jgi:hypothetical protein